MQLIRSELVKRTGQGGIVILLVAVVLLFVVGAMAALSIDVVSFYTARSEAQLAADAAALAGARVLANSGMTSDVNAMVDGLMANAQILSTQIAQQVASNTNNQVGGRSLNLSEITVSYPNTGSAAFGTNPQITVSVKRTDLPTFFARIWGRTAVTVQASATAEVYNPSGANALGGAVVPVAPTCVKPIVLPNMSPNGGAIINTAACPGLGCGAIADTTLVGETLAGSFLQSGCTNPGQCKASTLVTPAAWNYYPGDQSSFPAPTNALPACSAGFNAYQQSIAGCVQTPIACGSTVNLVPAYQAVRNDTDEAVNCLTNASGNNGDSVDPAFGPLNFLPFEFLAGASNPLVQAGTIAPATDVLVSDSIVTVPIYDSTAGTAPGVTVTVIGFVQLFLNSTGLETPPGSGQTITSVINIAGCGTGATGQPILGNGASPVPVRLITQP